MAAGYNVKIRGAYLIVGRIPYVTASGGIDIGAIVTSLDLIERRVEPTNQGPDTTYGIVDW